MDSVVVFLYTFFAIEAALFGIVIGSFLNVVIYRIPEGRTIVKGHSMCMTCGHTLVAKDLVPLFSWLFLKGKCRYCGAPVASRYAKIESFTGLVFLLAAIAHLEASFVIVTPNIFYIVLVANFILFLASCCVSISAMMIYHDTKKGYLQLALISLICGYISAILKILNIGATLKNIAIYLSTPFLMALIYIIVIRVFFAVFSNKYTKADLFADLTILGLLFHSDYTIVFTNYGTIKSSIIETIIYSVIYGLIRSSLKKGKKDKISVILGFVLIVILVIIRYSIMKLIYNY